MAQDYTTQLEGSVIIVPNKNWEIEVVLEDMVQNITGANGISLLLKVSQKFLFTFFTLFRICLCRKETNGNLY